MNLTLPQIAEILAIPGPVAEATVTGYSIDSRTVQAGELFFAIRGPRFDGHDFVSAALEAGAAAAVVEQDLKQGTPAGATVLRVPSTLGALATLATEVRQRWGRRLVAVTGSIGKTSTKEMIAAALATRYRVHKSEGNLNNQYGLPLSLLRLDDTHDVGVVELGMSRAGEIGELARIAQPDMGVVTCVSPVHLEFFSGIEEIAGAKQELIRALPASGTAVLNADDPFVSRFGQEFAGQSVSFGIERAADFRALDIVHSTRDGLPGVRFRLEWAGEPLEVALPLLGHHQVLNALAAIATAHAFGIPPDRAASALASFRHLKMRGELLEVNGVTVINDCYNSSPRALELMLQTLAHVPARGRRIAVLGEMLELGPASAELHRQAGGQAAVAADHVVGVRGHARFIVEGAAAARVAAGRLAFFESAAEAGVYVASLVQPGDLVLFKGSRGVKLEEVLEKLRLQISESGLRIEKDGPSAHEG